MNQLISIIIPAYNLEDYIERTIQSVLSQDYPNIEVIVVNDGSKDRTKEILDRLSAEHGNILQVFHIPNGGVTNARLTGVRAAKGEWIAFVDGDDLIEPNIYTTLMKNALEANADISHCGYIMDFPDRAVPYHGTRQKLCLNKEDGLVQLLSGKIIEPGLWNKLYKKALFTKLLHNAYMDLSIKINEDLLMNYYLFREANCSIFEDVCLYHYMVRSGSAANSGITKHWLLDPAKVRKLIMENSIDLPKVYPVACEAYIQQLVTLSTRSTKTIPNSLRPYLRHAQKQLRQLIRSRPPLSYSFRLKAIWGAYFPSSYSFVHRIYEKLRGYDKLYEIK